MNATGAVVCSDSVKRKVPRCGVVTKYALSAGHAMAPGCEGVAGLVSDAVNVRSAVERCIAPRVAERNVAGAAGC